jgi:hypothetical protein
LSSTRIDGAEQVPRSGPERTVAHPRVGREEPRADLVDPILRGLLAAQVSWLTRRDPAALRRDLIALLDCWDEAAGGGGLVARNRTLVFDRPAVYHDGRTQRASDLDGDPRSGGAVPRVAPGRLRMTSAVRGWAGNVRELRNALAYAFAIGDGPELVLADLPPEIAAAGEVGAEVVVAVADATADDDQTPEVRRIRDALGRTAGNRDRAAKLLGLSRVTLWRRMRALGLEDA